MTDREKRIDELVKQVDLSKVAREDRDTVRHILRSIYKFEEPIPTLQLDIYPVDGHYQLSVKGFNRLMNLQEWALRFRGEERDAGVRSVFGCSVDFGNKILILHINSASYDGDNESIPRGHGPMGGASVFKTIEGRAQRVELVKTIDMEDVAKQDRPAVETIFFAIYMFEEEMPELDVAVHRAAPDHYNISIKNFFKQISLEAWLNKFLGSRRDQRLEAVTGASFDPVEGVAVLHVNKREFTESKSLVPQRFRRKSKKK